MSPYTEPELIRAIEMNQVTAIQALGQWSRIQVHDEANLLWTISDIPFPLFNSVLRAPLPLGLVESAIQARIAEAKSRNVPLKWWIGPSTQPADLGDHLIAHGFVHVDQAPGMAVDLSEMRVAPPMPPGLVVQKAGDRDSLKAWSKTCGKVFEMPDFLVEAYEELLTLADRERFPVYLGWLDGKPVATSLLILADGCAGIYNVATLPEARRRGIGAVMTAVPLLEARSRGFRLGVLQASEMGIGVYRSLGFREYCQIHQYVWSGDAGEKT